MIRQKYHRKLYSRGVLEKAARDFSAVARVTIATGRNYYEVRFAGLDKQYSAQMLTGNFSNYVLMLIKTLHAA